MLKQRTKKIRICADHGGFELKKRILYFLRENYFEPIDFGATTLDENDDYPDYDIPLSKAVASGAVRRGIAICGSGVGACIAANKVTGVRAALINENFSAHQGVEDDDMNLMCLGGRVTGYVSAEKLVFTFLSAKFIGAERHLRRLMKTQNLEGEKN